MIIKTQKPKDLAIALTSRSTCSVKVAAVIYDVQGIFAWGWNNVGKGRGQCAEKMAIVRANPKRLEGSNIVIVSKRKGNFICSKPCPSCDSLIRAKKLSSFECLHHGWSIYIIGKVSDTITKYTPEMFEHGTSYELRK